ncbi:MAG TPA: ribonuclease P protein component [Luteimonas sp.]|nr:ribonuclease P protein component [Luteimonas sp.]
MTVATAADRLPSRVRFTQPKAARVRAGWEFEQTFKQGRRTATPLLALHWHDDDVSPRLGLAVSRKVDRRAVGRNRIKRALREQFRHLRPQLPKGRYVVVARPAAAACSGSVLRDTLTSVLLRAGALPAPAAAVTMPGAFPPPRTSPNPLGA